MPTELRCEKCGGRLAALGGQSLCPICLMQEAIQLGDERTPKPTRRADQQARSPAAAEQAGDRIGRYHLLQPIGLGGMGIVYLAAQEGPVQRRVALKVIKLGMDTEAVIARFEAERQILALMDHPNIARVLDAGVTEAGRPYFVMELVHGIKITEFCVQNHLPLRERLDLFITVCKAIQHAHQKGIIHRDLKPSNILVEHQNGVPVAKVIDFGIAKATGEQSVTDATPLTAFAQFLGTPAYMSPEQAAANGRDVDTRSDIYSLGVLLYELLTGQTPFDDGELRSAGIETMCRTIREQEPARPSSRLAQALTGNHRLESKIDQGAAVQRPGLKELMAQVRGDLDWIVMKTLEKDRTRRYETANGLAMDLERYLGNEPILARPPNATYRFQKLVRRNRLAVAAAGALTLTLLAGVTTTTWLYLRNKADLQRAFAAEQKATTVAVFLKGMLTDLNPAIAPGSHAKVLHGILDKTVERVAVELSAQPAIQAEMWSLIGNAYFELGDFSEAAARYREALRVRQALFGKRDDLVAASLNDLGNALTRQGDYPAGATLKRQALAIRRSRSGTAGGEVANALTSLAETLTDQMELAEAEALQREALALQLPRLDEGHPDVFASRNSLARLLRAGGRLAESETVYREAVAAVKGEANLAVGRALNQLAKVLAEEGKLAEAQRACRAALDMRRALLAPEHASVSDSFHFLTDLLQRQGKWVAVESLFRERLEWMERRMPAEEPEIIRTLVRFTEVLVAAHKFAEAEPFARESLGLREKKTPNDWCLFISRSVLGACLLGQEKYAEAEPWLISGYEGLKQREATMPAYGKPYLKEALQRLVALYIATDRPDSAAKWKQKLTAFDQENATTNVVSGAKSQ